MVIAVEVSAATTEPDDAESVTDVVADGTSEYDGADASAPKLKAVTTTSAIRLKNVFVDIYFLSLVVPETIPSTAGEASFAS